MIQENKELLIRDLCARLPYGVKVQVPDIDRGNCHKFESGIFTLHEINIYGLVEIFEEEIGVISIEDIKPILFPLSAINQEIEVGGEKIILTDFYTCINRINGGLETYMNPYIPIDVIWNYIDIFNRYHIDYRGLIDKCLAISVFDLQENPYK